MTPLAPTLQAFFTDRLTRQLHASPRTIASYRDTLQYSLSSIAGAVAPAVETAASRRTARCRSVDSRR